MARSRTRFVRKPVPERMMGGVEPLQYTLGEASAMFCVHAHDMCVVLSVASGQEE